MSTPTTLPCLYLVRHGETAWSRSGQHTGRTDIPLTARGAAAATELGHRLRNVPFAHVLTSPRQRARRTCELTGLNPTAVIEPDLMEWDYGDYEGQRSAEIRPERPDWNLFRDGCPRGETPAQVAARADRLIARLRMLEGNVALFTHGHFGRVLAARWIGLPVRAAQHFLLGPATLSILGFEHDRADQPAIVLWNAVASETASSAGDTRTARGRAIEQWENESGETPGKVAGRSGSRCRVTPHVGHARFRLHSAETKLVILQNKSNHMKSSTKDKAKGIAKTIAGKVKEVTGKAIGNPRLQIAGKAEQLEGKAQKKIGQIKKARGN